MDPIDRAMEWAQRQLDGEKHAAADRERALQAEVERLRGKCNRLRDYIAEIWANEEGRPDTPEGRRDMELNIRLHPDDMTPEPPGAASEVEGE